MQFHIDQCELNRTKNIRSKHIKNCKRFSFKSLCDNRERNDNWKNTKYNTKNRNKMQRIFT